MLDFVLVEARETELTTSILSRAKLLVDCREPAKMWKYPLQYPRVSPAGEPPHSLIHTDNKQLERDEE